MATLEIEAPTVSAAAGSRTVAHGQRQKRAAVGIDQPDQQRPDQRAAHRTDAADDDDDEGQDQDLLSHADLDGQHRPGHRPGQPGQHGADRKHDGEQPVDVDAERPDHVAMRRPGPDQHADPGVQDQVAQAQPDPQTDPDDKQAVGRIGHARQHFHRPGQEFRRRQEQGLGAPDHLDQFVEEQDDAEGRQNLIQMVAPVELSQRDDLDQRPDQPGRHQGRDHADQKIPRGLGHRRRDIGADHVQRPMGQVDQVHDPEHQGQPGRQQEQHDALLQSVQGLLEKKLCGHRLSMRRAGPPRPTGKLPGAGELPNH